MCLTCYFRHGSCAQFFSSSFKIYRAFSHNSAARMPPIEKPIPSEKYDIVFIGGGSGGSAGSVCHPSYVVVSTSYRNVHIASRVALWCQDSNHRGIRKTRRHLRERW